MPLCDSIWARAAPLCPRGWRLFLPHLREVLSLRVWRCWLGIFSEQWMLRQGSGACAAPICYHGTAPAHGEMPALIGQKCQGKIGSDGRAQFCCKSPALCKNCPLQSCGMQRWAFSICWCSFPSDFPLISLWFPFSSWGLLSPTLQTKPGLAPGSSASLSTPSWTAELCPVWLQWMISRVLRTCQECCGWWWSPILLVLCISLTTGSLSFFLNKHCSAEQSVTQRVTL